LIQLNELQKIFRGRVALNEPLSRYTSFRIGGPADYFFEPADTEDLIALVNYLRGRDVPLMIVGKGSNMLVADEGIRGAVINLQEGFDQCAIENDLIRVGAGMTIARFVDFCIRNSFKGVEMLAGIPGTVGGAIIMNAGAYGGEISDTLVDVEILRAGRIVRIPRAEAGFAYRKSAVAGDIVLGGTFRMERGDVEELMEMRRELLIKRNRAQPVNFPNSGSMFKNPPGSHAARLIEEAGLKGKRSGMAQISEKHANFIVNHGDARAEDVLALITQARDAVRKKFGISLELEVKLVGYPENVHHEVES
jgi:UDP-N-acetylmuramate dehydrogenase